MMWIIKDNSITPKKDPAQNQNTYNFDMESENNICIEIDPGI